MKEQITKVLGKSAKVEYQYFQIRHFLNDLLQTLLVAD